MKPLAPEDSTEAARRGKAVALVYLFDEPTSFPDGASIATAVLDAHREVVAHFTAAVQGGLTFAACTYADLLSAWAAAPEDALRRHAEEVRRAYAIAAPGERRGPDEGGSA